MTLFARERRQRHVHGQRRGHLRGQLPRQMPRQRGFAGARLPQHHPAPRPLTARVMRGPLHQLTQREPRELAVVPGQGPALGAEGKLHEHRIELTKDLRKQPKRPIVRNAHALSVRRKHARGVAWRSRRAPIELGVKPVDPGLDVAKILPGAARLRKLRGLSFSEVGHAAQERKESLGEEVLELLLRQLCALL